MPVRLQFIIMSSGEDDAILTQLIDALAPWPVLIHQDASRPRVRPPAMRRGVRWMSPSVATGWGDWGFAHAIGLSIADALRHGNFDYLQLLSPSCLPIRPLAELIDHVAHDAADHHADTFALDRDRDTAMSFAWRAYAPSGSERQKLLSRLRRWYFGDSPLLSQQHSMSLLHREQPAQGVERFRAAAGFALTRLMAVSQPAAVDRPGTVGSVWFGARREVCERLVAIAATKSVRRRFSPLTMVDELLIPTLLKHAGRRAGPSNHAVSNFDESGHPIQIDLPGLRQAESSGRFFARKFSPDPRCACRQLALEWAGVNSQGAGVNSQGSESGRWAQIGPEPIGAPPEYPGSRSSPSDGRTG